MPLPFLIALGIALGAGAAAAVVVRFWDRILDWAQTMFLPWVNKYLPFLAADARRAFMSLHGVVAAVRMTICEAWRALRTRLVRQMVEFSRDANSRWVVKTINWVIASFSPQENPSIDEYSQKRIVPIEEVPPEVLERWLRLNENTISFDLTKVRDQEVLDMRMEEE